MYLIFINKVGKNFDNDIIYEFLFSETTKNIDGDEWDTYPAMGRPNPPLKKFISSVGVIKTKIELKLIQESSEFCMWDAVDGLISLGWENVEGYDTYPEKRLFFTFGEELNKVKDKLYEYDIHVDYKTI